MYEIVTRSEPWAKLPAMQAAHGVMSGKRMPIPDCDPILQKIMSECWKQDPSERPEFKDILVWLEETEESNRKDDRYVDFSESFAEYKITEDSSCT